MHKSFSCYLVLLLVVFVQVATAQGTSKHLDKANAYYSIRSYEKAIPEYEKYLRSHRNASDCELKLADCYRRTGDYERSEELYKEYCQSSSAEDSVRVKYAEVLKRQGKYKLAKQEYKKMSATFYHKDLCVANCDSFSAPLSKQRYRVENLAKINSIHSDIAPVIYPDGLVFSSNREETIIKKKSSNASVPLYNILLAQGTDSKYPDKVSNFSTRINTVHHECCASFTGDYKKIFFTRSIDKPYNNDPGSKNALKMYSASFEKNSWSNWETFAFNDTTRSYGHPSVDPNEELFFFVSDMEGGYGGSDIYVCFSIDHKWTKPINLGPHVNSPYNDMYPFYGSDGLLYFSSNRPEGMGGYDIYSASENEEGEYEYVKNAGAPINSIRDDLSIFWSKDKKVGYFSSNREGGKGEEDLYIILPR